METPSHMAPPPPMASPVGRSEPVNADDDWALPPEIEADMRARMAPQIERQAPVQDQGPIQQRVSSRDFAPSAVTDAGFATPGLDLPPPVPAKKQKKAKAPKTAGAEQAISSKKRRTGRQMRRNRRRRRVWFEELMGWVFVPVILYATYWAVISFLALFGKTPQEVIEGLTQLYRGFH